ncbi:MAG: aminoacyl-tRNA hydrolase [Candidatus Falkowbacteria bacterium]|nr:aminoacyl-tRNA hydrolase [Candidatus Falkowbacteria bacterium]
MKVIVGLGNPGPEYQNTRHNLGFLALDNLFPEAQYKEEKRFEALVAKYPEGLLVKPLTFMNNSGRAVRKVLDYYGLIPKNFGLLAKKDSDLSDVLVVIQDDLDLDFGVTKIAKDSGSAGHNGIKSIISHLKTQKITRVRLGVKNELFRNPIPADKFVLARFNAEEKSRLPEILSEIRKNL